jgi:hypothetical protein
MYPRRIPSTSLATANRFHQIKSRIRYIDPKAYADSSQIAGRGSVTIDGAKIHWDGRGLYRDPVRSGHGSHPSKPTQDLTPNYTHEWVQIPVLHTSTDETTRKEELFGQLPDDWIEHNGVIWIGMVKMMDDRPSILGRVDHSVHFRTWLYELGIPWGSA